jgi:hypothetical protein
LNNVWHGGNPVAFNEILRFLWILSKVMGLIHLSGIKFDWITANSAAPARRETYLLLKAQVFTERWAALRASRFVPLATYIVFGLEIFLRNGNFSKFFEIFLKKVDGN